MPTASGGLDKAKIGSIEQPGGAPQVTDNGRPLYDYTIDTTTKATSG
jgi:hypothetical protein